MHTSFYEPPGIAVINTPRVRRPLVHMRQHLAKRQRHIGIGRQQWHRTQREGLMQRHRPWRAARSIRRERCGSAPP